MKQETTDELTVRGRLRSMRHYLLIEPIGWIFLCFFQPAHFSREYERRSFKGRVPIMVRLFLPLFFASCSVAILMQLFLSHCILCASDITFSTVIYGVLAFIQKVALGVFCGIVIGALEDIGLGIVLSLALGIVGTIGGRIDISVAFTITMIVGLLGGTIKGLSWGIKIGIWGCIAATLAWCVASILANGRIDGRTVENFILLATTFLASYITGYYRLPLYPINLFSTWYTYELSKKNPSQAVMYLKKSALHWDERVSLPLPFLRDTIVMAEKQDKPGISEEIEFIMFKRPEQSSAALGALRYIALNAIKDYKTINSIANAHSVLADLRIFEYTHGNRSIKSNGIDAFERLRDTSSEKNHLGTSDWMDAFDHLRDASLQASSYLSSTKRTVDRRKDLNDMLDFLQKIQSNAFPKIELNDLLKEIVPNWKNAAREALEKLKQEPETIGQIENPYRPGDILELNDPLFVGREDIGNELSASLRGEHHGIMFLLNGERRMGKTCTLKHLPRLLGASYIPIFYDLQSPAIFSRINKFLGHIAEKICKTLRGRGIEVANLDQASLFDALSISVAEVYSIFDQWLDYLEMRLKSTSRTVLLLFDEFERLQEEGGKHLDLESLLNWFRSTVQDTSLSRTRIKILFSGVQTSEELNINWSGHLINAKTFRINFLDPIYARKLILEPIHGKNIFDEEMVEEILHITGRHPFLLQAMCSEFIDFLNHENLEKAEIRHIDSVAEKVMERWQSGYFQDLWQKRVDSHQKRCLRIIVQIRKECSIDTIAQYVEMNRQDLRQTLQTLVKRDLILQEQATYRLAVPLLGLWIEHNA